MSDNSIPGLSVSTAPAPPPGLINAAPGSSTQVPGDTPLGGTVGAPVTSYNPAQAQAVAGTPKPFQITPDQTVSGQIKNIIAAGSPLMQQAEARAKDQMNDRGLINSSIAVGAGQSALYAAAAPIATADATTAANAATNTTTAQNQAIAAETAARNTASLANAGATNTALGSAATASNTVATTAQQIAGSTNIAQIQSATSKAIASLQSDTTLTAQDKQNAGQQLIASIQANTALTETDKTTLSNQVIAQLQASTTIQTTTAQIASAKDLATLQGQVQTAIANIQANTSMSNQDKQDATSQIIAGIQSNTQLSVADKAAAAQAVTTAANNASAKLIADIQASTTLSIADKQTLSAQIIAGLNNQNAKDVQAMVNAGNLATIQANGAINVQITNLTNTNKLLLQTSSAAASIYQQTLANMATIMGNKDLSPDQKTSALNSSVATLSDALKAISDVANNQAISTTLNFTTPADTTPQNVTLADGSTITINDGQASPTPTTTATPAETPAATATPQPSPTPRPLTPTPTPPPSPPTIVQTANGPIMSTAGLDRLSANYVTIAQGQGANMTQQQFVDSPVFQGFTQSLQNEYKTITDPATLQSQLAYQQSRVNDPIYGPSAQALVATLQQQVAKVGG